MVCILLNMGCGSWVRHELGPQMYRVLGRGRSNRINDIGYLRSSARWLECREEAAEK